MGRNLVKQGLKIGEDRREKLRRLKEDPVLFSEVFLGFQPFPYQERLLRDPSKRIVSCMGRQTGKTTTIAVKAIQFAYTNPKTTTLIVAPSRRQSIIMFDRILSFIHGNKWLHKSVVRMTRTVIQLDSGSRIIALPASMNLLRGFTADLIVCDEAAFMEEELIVQVMFPMLATTSGSLILLSTPWGRENVFYRAFMDPDYSSYHVKSCECPLISEDFLEEQRRNMTEEAYRREYEADFMEAVASYFSQDLIRSCVDTELELETDLEGVKPEPGEYYAGCDLGKLRDFSVLAVVRRVGEGVRLVFLREFPLETPYPSIIGAIVRANEKFGLRKILIDKSGVGEAVTDEIKNQGLNNAEGASFSGEKKAEYLAHLRIKMEQGEFKMPYDRRLCQQINEQQYEYTKSGRLHFWHPPNGHDDQLWALALAVTASKRGEPSGVLARAW